MRKQDSKQTLRMTDMEVYNIGRKGTDSGEGKGVFQIGFQGRSSTILRR